MRQFAEFKILQGNSWPLFFSAGFPSNGLHDLYELQSKYTLPDEKDHVACFWKQGARHVGKALNSSLHRTHDFFL